MTITISSETAEILEATANAENRTPANVAATVVEQWADSEEIVIRPRAAASAVSKGKDIAATK